jgi:flagellar motility protein MotE (MotC chaperone)
MRGPTPNRMSGFFDKIRDASKDALGTFVEFEEDRDPTVAMPARPSAPSAPVHHAPAPSAPTQGAAAPDPEFVKQLHAAVAASGKPAYAQFRALFEALSVLPDPTQRAQAALSAAKASHGVDAAAVAAAIDDRLRILDGEKAAFDRAVKTESDASVGGTQSEIEKARAEIARRQEQIKALEARAAELERTLQESRAALEASSARFAASYAAVHAELAAERARIAPFLTPTV